MSYIKRLIKSNDCLKLIRAGEVQFNYMEKKGSCQEKKDKKNIKKLSFYPLTNFHI